MGNKVGGSADKVPQWTEIGFRKWISRITEKLYFIELSIKEKREISEADYELWDVLHHSVYAMGEYPIYSHFDGSVIKSDEKTVEQGLFDKNDIQVVGGTEVESSAEDKT